MSVLDISGTAPTPFWRLVRVELRKSYDTRAGFWLIMSIGLIVLAVEAFAVILIAVEDESVDFGGLVLTAAFITSIFLPILGIMLVTTEWSQRSAVVTFALEPRRGMVIAAKAAAGVLLAVATVVVSLAIGFVANVAFGLLAGGADWSFGWGDFWAFLVTQILAMLGGFALAALLLNTSAAIVVFFLYKWVLPSLLFGLAALMGWFGDLRPWIDFQSAQDAIWSWSTSGEEWAQLVVSSIVWLVLPLAIGVRRVLGAEVK